MRSGIIPTQSRADLGESPSVLIVRDTPAPGAVGVSSLKVGRQQVDGLRRVPGEEDQTCDSQARDHRRGRGRQDPPSAKAEAKRKGRRQDREGEAGQIGHLGRNSLMRPSSAPRFWNSMTRWLPSTGHPLQRFLHSVCSRQTSVNAVTGLEADPWPIAAPYDLEGDAKRSRASCLSPEERGRRKAVNLVVLTLSWLHLGKPSAAPLPCRESSGRLSDDLRSSSGTWQLLET